VLPADLALQAALGRAASTFRVRGHADRLVEPHLAADGVHAGQICPPAVPCALLLEFATVAVPTVQLGELRKKKKGREEGARGKKDISPQFSSKARNEYFMGCGIQEQI